ncbi:sigma-70 RNA polymerase sigma factor region 4 domain-containing protein [Fusibacter bizertensis]
MKIIEEYRQLTEEIAVLNSKIKSKERALNKLMMTYAPSGSKAIDYSSVRVQSKKNLPDIIEIADKIYEVKGELSDLKAELEEVVEQRDTLDEFIKTLGESKATALTLRIKGFTNRQISCEMHMSQRHIERLVSEANQKLVNY